MDKNEKTLAGVLLCVLSLLFFLFSYYVPTGEEGRHLIEYALMFGVLSIVIAAIIGEVWNKLTIVEIFCSVLLLTICFASGKIFSLDSIGIHDLRLIVVLFFSLLFVGTFIYLIVEPENNTTDDKADAVAQVG